jgi:isoprenylcysteine carboxyl methyltransferase (ICMT) family protein YpbQ
MIFLLSILVLWGSTLGIVALDKSMRTKKVAADGVPDFGAEPSWGVLTAICILFNIAALPYYFYSTRRSALWGLVGFGAFLGCFVLMVIIQTLGALAHIH